jgi:hypothetical protein
VVTFLLFLCYLLACLRFLHLPNNPASLYLSYSVLLNINNPFKYKPLLTTLSYMNINIHASSKEQNAYIFVIRQSGWYRKGLFTRIFFIFDWLLNSEY